jgi:hypothetical protein
MAMNSINIFDVLSGRVNSPNLLSVLVLIAPQYPTRGTEFLRIGSGFMNQCRVQCDSLMRSLVCLIWIFESSEATFVDLSNSSSIFRDYCALPLPCCCALSFSTVNMLSGRLMLLSRQLSEISHRNSASVEFIVFT